VCSESASHLNRRGCVRDRTESYETDPEAGWMDGLYWVTISNAKFGLFSKCIDLTQLLTRPSPPPPDCGVLPSLSSSSLSPSEPESPGKDQKLRQFPSRILRTPPPLPRPTQLWQRKESMEFWV
jgi:hypothetical protein